ncbi:MAG: hypothetical protein AAFU85_14910 [Planctomycetota bacterium]
MKRSPFSIRTLLLFQLALPILLIALSHLRVVDFHYHRYIENEPQRNPQAVDRLEDGQLYLADGRCVVLESRDAGMLEQMEDWDRLVDVEPSEVSNVRLYRKRQYYLCALPPEVWVRLPLIPIDIPSNHRDPLGNGRLLAQPRAK